MSPSILLYEDDSEEENKMKTEPVLQNLYLFSQAARGVFLLLSLVVKSQPN